MVITIPNILTVLGVLIVYTGWSLLQEEKEIIRRILLLVAFVALFLITIVYDWMRSLWSKVNDLEIVNKNKLRELRASQRQIAEVEERLRRESEDSD